jgi:hypothetical protein
MINAPQGMAAGLPGAAGGSSCAVTQAPPPISGGGIPTAAVGVSFPTAPTAGPSFSTPVVPTTGASTAALGATTIGGANAAPVNVNFPDTVPASATLAGFGMPAANVIPAAAPVAGINTAPINTNGTGAAFPSTSAAGTIAALTGTPATPGTGAIGANAAPVAAAATRPLTSLAPGGSAQDAALVERTLGTLRQSPAGAQIVDRLLAVGARVNVISDQEFAAMGHDSAHAFYDPKIDTMFLRRSDLADNTNVQFAAVALAHEGTHLLDDVAKLSDPFISEVTQRVAAAGGLGTAQGAAIRDQAMFELTMIKETRAFLFAGQVARELNVTLPSNDPTSTAIAGANDQATFNAVWQRLLQSSYNEQGRTATPRNL